MTLAERKRPTRSIKEELAELTGLIAENESLMEIHQEDDALKLSLEGLKHRQQELLKELYVARKESLFHTFDILFEGESVHGTSMSLGVAGEILSALQDTVTSLVNKRIRGVHAGNKISDDVRRRSEMVLVTTAPGSFRVIVGGPELQFLDDSIYEQALANLNGIIRCGSEKISMKKMRTDVGPRTFYKYKRLVKALKVGKTSMTLYDSMGKEKFSPVKINTADAEKIFEAITDVEEMPEETIVETGYLTGCLFDTRLFHFLTDEGRKIEGKLSEGVTGTIAKPCIDENLDKKRHSRATFVVRSEYNEVEDREYKKWTLTDIELISESSSAPRS